MPNYITNILICDDHEILEKILNDDGHVDFEIIKPMPEAIANTSCGGVIMYENNSISEYIEREKTRRPLNETELALGAGEGWYDWSKRNWGTKWNASETKVLDSYTYSFQTAWSPPYNYLKALAEKYKFTPFYLYWKDEGFDGGFNQKIFLNSEKDDGTK